MSELGLFDVFYENYGDTLKGIVLYNLICNQYK